MPKEGGWLFTLHERKVDFPKALEPPGQNANPRARIMQSTQLLRALGLGQHSRPKGLRVGEIP